MSRLVFAGTPEFAAEALTAILAAGHSVVAVLTQPDRRSGRGMRLVASAVKQVAEAHGIPVLQPRSLRTDGKYPEEAAAALRALREADVDVMVVAAYGLILPQQVLEAPRRGCLNIHASLLPRWRGAAPIQRAIEAGDAVSGVTIMQMDAGLDTGAMVQCVEHPISADETGASLHDGLARIGAQAIVDVLARLDRLGADEPLASRPQPEAGACYAAKLAKSEAALDFSLPAQVLERRIRAFDPFPGATMALPGFADPVKVWRAHALPPDEREDPASPGAVLRATPDGIDVATGEGVLRIVMLQQPGGRRQPVDVFVRHWSPPG